MVLPVVFNDGPKDTRFVLSSEVYKKVVSKNHLLFRINEEIDFSFVNKECKDLYTPNIGRNVINYPEIMFKAEIIQYMYCLSERQLKARSSENLVFRWFLGYELDDEIFHFTAPGKFRNALGEKRHRELFNHILEQFKNKGLLNEFENQSMDATHIISDIAIPTTIALIKQAIIAVLRSSEIDGPVNREYYLGKEEKKEFRMSEKEKRITLKRVVIDAKSLIDHFKYTDLKKDSDTYRSIEQLKSILQDYIEDVETDDSTEPKERKKKGKDRTVSLVDKDARWGAKSDEKIFLGYKAHTSQTDRQIITDVKVTPGNVGDDRELPANLHRQKKKGLSPKKMRGDGIYGTIDNRKVAKEMGTNLVAPPRTSHNRGNRFSKDEFDYNKEMKKVTCPAGQTTMKCYWNKNGKSWIYLFDKETCGYCALKERCTKNKFRTVAFKKDYHIQQEALQYSKTPEYKEDMKIRSHIEPKQAEMKRFHGLKRAYYRGLEKVNIQAIYTALVINLKRMVTLLASDSHGKIHNIA
jgi:transposase